MVDIARLRSQIVLKGHTQKSVVAEMKKRGIKISENTFSAKMNGASPFDCEIADALCDILDIDAPADKALIFLA